MKLETFIQKANKEKDEKQRHLLSLTIKIGQAVKVKGGRALVVGGYVRDALMQKSGFDIVPKDIDLEIFGLGLTKLKGLLETIGPVNEVGVSFSVLKIDQLDIALPRKDTRTGPGHRNFLVENDPGLSFAEAARRRDFTINAMALDPLSGEVLDEHNGLDDLAQSKLRAVDPVLFGEDPLRVLRAMQFGGRFDFTIESRTAELCRVLDLTDISPERIGEEWVKLLLKAKKPSLGLEIALNLKIVERLAPELLAMVGTPQSPLYHPEGDVWVHALMVVDAAADLIRRQKLETQSQLILMLVALCHDLGKPSTTKVQGQRITSYGHAKAGILPTLHFLKTLAMPKSVIDQVVPLVREHMYPAFNKDLSDAALRRLSVRLSPATIEELVWSSEADRRGTAKPWRGFPEAKRLLDRARALSIEDSKPKPIVMGRHLISEGLAPGPDFKKILNNLFEAQIEGQFSNLDEGLEYFRQKILTKLISKSFDKLRINSTAD